MVCRGERSQNEIPLRSYTHVISAFGRQRLAKRVNTRLDQLLAIVVRRTWKTNGPHQRALLGLWKDLAFAFSGTALPSQTSDKVPLGL